MFYIKNKKGLYFAYALWGFANWTEDHEEAYPYNSRVSAEEDLLFYEMLDHVIVKVDQDNL